MTYFSAHIHRSKIRLFDRALSAMAILMMVVVMMMSQGAAGQVVLDMPPPPPAKRIAAPLAQLPLSAEPSTPAQVHPAPGETTSEPATVITGAAAMPPTTAAPQPEVTVGDVAIFRYSRVRTGAYDTYYENDLYRAGIRTYSYPRYFPQFVWGPWFFPFFHFHHHCW